MNKNTLTITNSSKYNIYIGRYNSVRNLRKALEKVGHDVVNKTCYIKQVHSSVPCKARDNYVIQKGDQIEFTNAEQKKGALNEKMEAPTVKVDKLKYAVVGNVLVGIY